MGTSVVLFRLFDIDVRVHWSFVLVLVYGAFIYADGPAGPIFGALYGILVILLLFVCVTLHEFGHALVAKRYHVGVSNITLLPIGGVANLERMPDKPMQELMITLAGPLVNFAIAIVLMPLTFVAAALEVGSPAALTVPGFVQMMQTPGVTSLLAYLLGVNIALGLFNLLPAFPMDGGRILRALLAMNLPYVRATRIAVVVGRLLAVGFAVFGLFSGNIWLLLIAFFVYVGGSAEQESVESRTVLRNIAVSSALTRSAVSLYSSERISRAVDLIMNSYQTDYPVLDLSGKFIGVLTRPRLIEALREAGTEARVVDVMLPAEKIPTVTPANNLAEVWEQMATGGARVVAVRNQGEFVGLLTLEDITEVFHVMGAAMAGGARPTSGGGLATPAPAAETASVDAKLDG